MKLKDIEPGVMYACTRYAERGMKVTSDKEGRLKLADKDYDTLNTRVFPARVLEVGVRVGHYDRPGVRVEEYDRHSMQRSLGYQPMAATDNWHHAKAEGPLNLSDPIELRTMQVIMPWEEWIDLYHEHAAQVEEEQERREEQRRIEQARRQEKAAVDWMEREFTYARETIIEIMEVIDGAEDYEPSDDQVKALVEHRNPDGNPYLTGERQAH